MTKTNISQCLLSAVRHSLSLQGKLCELGEDIQWTNSTGNAKKLDKPTQMSRITQESHRPRVSDRTMVDIVTTAQACLVSRFEWRCRNRNRSATEMEKRKSTKLVEDTSEPSVLLAPRGWKSR